MGGVAPQEVSLEGFWQRLWVGGPAAEPQWLPKQGLWATAQSAGAGEPRRVVDSELIRACGRLGAAAGWLSL